ncbi:MAG: tungstate transport system ATP-binding protein [Eubacteriaceae bacterium]|jgi:tungstate transport system ATP-binding protein|nr:tungstate transport system ATP-binding protein [Eubacteriaceae bacterium]MDN5308256.1 tungstate transport system ATP-binding protein [Eubacteriaceae bacterium]
MNLKINQIKKIYGEKTVLSIQQENLVFRNGQINGIIGPNGSGKSTLMRIIADLTTATSGTIFYDNSPLDDDLRKLLTYASQQAFMLSKTVEENIRYPLKLRNYSKVDQQRIAAEQLETFQLEAIRTQKAKNLSGGEAQKTALARALSFSPKLLLLDEPTASIDPQSIKIIESALLKRKIDPSLNTIIITHNLSQAFRICDTLTFIHQGNILFTGLPDDLMHDPNPIIKEFISFN